MTFAKPPNVKHEDKILCEGLLPVTKRQNRSTTTNEYESKCSPNQKDRNI